MRYDFLFSLTKAIVILDHFRQRVACAREFRFFASVMSVVKIILQIMHRVQESRNEPSRKWK